MLVTAHPFSKLPPTRKSPLESPKTFSQESREESLFQYFQTRKSPSCFSRRKPPPAQAAWKRVPARPRRAPCGSPPPPPAAPRGPGRPARLRSPQSPRGAVNEPALPPSAPPNPGGGAGGSAAGRRCRPPGEGSGPRRPEGEAARALRGTCPGRGPRGGRCPRSGAERRCPAAARGVPSRGVPSRCLRRSRAPLPGSGRDGERALLLSF